MIAFSGPTGCEYAHFGCMKPVKIDLNSCHTYHLHHFDHKPNQVLIILIKSFENPCKVQCDYEIANSICKLTCLNAVLAENVNPTKISKIKDK